MSDHCPHGPSDGEECLNCRIVGADPRLVQLETRLQCVRLMADDLPQTDPRTGIMRMMLGEAMTLVREMLGGREP